MDIIKKYFPELSNKQIAQFEQLSSLYREWNSRINVISRKDIDQLYERHVLHSLSIAKLIQFKKGTRILDAGTGGGFPGIPLSIMFPDTTFHLADSIAKKIKVVNAIKDELGLSNVIGWQSRVEEIRGKYDFIVSRAVTSMPVFYGWVKNSIRKESFNDIPNGILYLKGGDIVAEMKGLKKPKKIYPISDWFDEAFFETKIIVHLK